MIFSFEMSTILASQRRARVLPVANGDHLTSAEFLDYFEGSEERTKVELIEGRVFMFPPLSSELHGEPDNFLQGWLFHYAAFTPGVKAYCNSTLILDADNAPQPDGILCTKPRDGHSVWLDKKGYLCGRPEFVFETAASSASIDLHDKKDLYCKHGIAEYLVWVTGERRVHWFVLDQGQYVE